MSKTINLGRVTAYADAVAAGYTGTREQFANDLANAANYAAEAGDAAETATEAATTASTAAETATDKAEEASADAEQAHADAQAILVAKETAVAAANTASSKAGEAANSAQQAAASETAAAGSATTASNAATSATASKNAAAASETNAANSASQASQTLTNVNQAGATQVAAIQAKGTEVLNSIPADYTELSNDVDDLKSDIIEDESNYGTYAIGVKNYYSATIEKTVNYYIADDGTVTQYDNMWYSDLIPVDATDCRFVVDADDGTANAVRIHGYDANGAWVRMLAKYTNVGSGKAVVDSIISIPSNVVYVRLSMYRTKHVAYLGTGLKPLTERFEEEYHVGVGKDYTSFSACIKALANNSKQKVIYVDGGIYDIYSEIGGDTYAASIGNDIWSVYNDIVPPNTRIVGIGNVVFKFNCTSANSNAINKLSPVNVKWSVELENITIIASNCRYAVHDDASSDSSANYSKHIYKNVKVVKEQGGYPQAFGGGIGKGSIFEFDGCIFKGDSPVSFHSNIGSYDGIITFKDCAFESTNVNGYALRLSGMAEYTGEQSIITNLYGCHLNNRLLLRREDPLIASENNPFKVSLIECGEVNIDTSGYTLSELRYTPVVYPIPSVDYQGQIVNLENDLVEQTGQRNLLKNVSFVENAYLDDGGTPTPNDSFHYTSLVRVVDNVILLLNDGPTATRIRVHGYDSNGNWNRILYSWNIGGANEVKQFSIDIPSGIEYIRISIAKNKAIIKLNEGRALKDDVNLIETRFNEVFRESTNLIILENAQNGVVLVQGTGEVQDNARFSTTEFIKVNTDTPYSFKYVRRIAMYDSNMSFISALQYDSVTVAQTINSGKAEYLRLSFESTYSSMVLLNKSATLLDYEKGYRYVKEKFVDKQIITDLIESYSPANNDKYYFSPRMPSGLYKAQTCEGYNATSHFTDTISLSDIYGVYDAMVAQNPDYATRTLLGKDQTGEYDIFMYDFNPVEANAINFTAQLPKIVITTDTHGEEKSSTIGLRNFMRDICNNWVDDDLLEYLRWNVHFIIIPIVNPYGFVNHTRQNGRNVDLNRNFDAYWDSFPYDEDHYKGDSPFSEKESQYVRDVILANPDIACFIDYHMNGSNYTFNEWFRTFWFDLMAEEPDKGNLRTVAKSTARDMTALGQARYDVPRNSGTLGLITIEGNTPMLAKWVSLQGITSLVIEATNRILGETETYTAKCNQFNTEFTGNWILNILRQLYRKSVFS